MPINEKMVDRIREMLAVTDLPVEEKKMFSGMCFMVDDKMCVCVRAEDIMVRLDPATAQKLADEHEGCEMMVMGGRVMKGYVSVQEDTLRTKRELNFWVQLALDFNPCAKSSKKKK